MDLKSLKSIDIVPVIEGSDNVMSIFNNLKVAFKDKSNFELNRSLLIFSIISNPIISKSLITLTKTLIKN